MKTFNLRWFIWLCLLGITGVLAVPERAAAQGHTKLVLAFYYAWYDPSSFNDGKTAFNNPNPYFSADAGTIQKHVQQAKNAGIDAFVQAWYGPDDNNQTETNFKTLLNTASANGFKAAIYFESGSPFHGGQGDRVNALRHAIHNHANHPAYLQVDGKPVVFFWANWLYSVNEWQQIRNQVDPGNNTIWIGEGGHTDYLSVFDGLHLYNTAWAGSPAGTAATWAANTRAAASTQGSYKYWVATAMPGWDDTRLGRGDAAFAKNRANGDFYRQSFQGAAASNPDMLIITSFNEWPEGSHIEPANEFGNYYLNLTAQFSRDYKAGAGISPPPPPQPQPTNQPSNPPPTPTTTEAYPISPAANTQVESPETQNQTPAPTRFPSPTPSPVLQPSPQADGRIIYHVVPGDTFITIAEKYDLEISLLYAYNDLDPQTAILREGQELTIGFADHYKGTRYLTGFPHARLLPDGTLLHLVTAGDSLVGIATTYGVTLDELYNRNNFTNESILQIDQQVVVARTPMPQTVGGSTDSELPSPTATTTPFPTATFTPVPSIAPELIVTLPPVAPSTRLPPSTSIPPTPTIVITPEPFPVPTGSFFPLLAGGIGFLLIAGILFIYIGRK